MLTRNDVSAMLLMAGGIATLVSMDAVVKELVTAGVHAVQLLALRSVLITAALLLIFHARGETRQLKPTRWRWQLVRATVGFLAPCAFFMSLLFLPQADATVMFFSAPLVVTVCSVLFLGERFGIHRWIAILVGFVGVVIALDPEGGADWRGYSLALVGSLAYAALFLVGKYLSRTETTASLVMAYNVGVGVVGLCLLPWFWVPMTNLQWLQLALLATLAVTGHFMVTAAFARAEASLLSPIEYTSLFWAIAFDWLLWQHAPNGQTLLGGTVVILAGLYFIHRERLSSRQDETRATV
ncbi:MAG: DMT family transporter [Pseudomonadota bacterium]